ncbi:hypothetical protein Cflav_PD5981 [Pedosphaera parvula Ellin514]|uniref:Uncharacterized protein n=1 Tax=Pedosphaera parvula (strain Ellin514) TaxID=320771 RepID=B9XA05_PEDPL|nr:hypothetical protein Cflav_PD5981 [Pedosphaera parvula Ellin514]
MSTKSELKGVWEAEGTWFGTKLSHKKAFPTHQCLRVFRNGWLFIFAKGAYRQVHTHGSFTGHFVALGSNLTMSPASPAPLTTRTCLKTPHR